MNVLQFKFWILEKIYMTSLTVEDWRLKMYVPHLLGNSPPIVGLVEDFSFHTHNASKVVYGLADVLLSP